MNAKHWLIGCVLGVAGFGTAAAATLDTQGIADASHSTAESGGQGDVASAPVGGDILDLNHSTDNADEAGDNSNNDAVQNVTHGGIGTGSERANGSMQPSHPPKRPHLGWQSLLPGSIQ